MMNEIITGIIAGLIYSLTGWQSSKEDFDWNKLCKSVLISGVVGAIAGATGQQFDVLILGGIGIGVTSLVNKIIKIITNKLK